MLESKKILIYHGGCPDGFGAAFVFNLKFGDKIIYHPMKHGDSFDLDVTDAEVFMVDIALKRNVIEDILSKAKKLTILDHHISEYESLKDLDCYNFDINHSGAMLAWLFLFPDQEPPLLIKCVEDRDLHNFKVPDSLTILAALDCRGLVMGEWLAFHIRLDYPEGRESILSEGQAIQSYQKILLDIICKTAFKVKIDGHIVPIVNTVFLKSEAANN